MAILAWDKSGQKFFEAGVDRGVLFPNGSKGVAWNGIVSIEETSSGGETEASYFDGFKYFDNVASTDFQATLEAFTYPDEFAACEGIIEIAPGLVYANQTRQTFGLAWRTKVGNDLDGIEHGYRLHMVYNATAAPSSRSYTTLSDSPGPVTFSWTIDAVPNMPGQDLSDQSAPGGWAWPEGYGMSGWPMGPDGNTPVRGWRATAYIMVESKDVDPETLTNLENMLYGTPTTPAYMPSQFDVTNMLSGHDVPINPPFDYTPDPPPVDPGGGGGGGGGGAGVTANLVAVGRNSFIMTGGTTPTKRTPPLVQSDDTGSYYGWTAVAYEPSHSVYVACGYGYDNNSGLMKSAVLISSNGGVTWVDKTPSLSSSSTGLFDAIGILPSGRIVVSGHMQTAMFSDDGGQIWDTSTSNNVFGNPDTYPDYPDSWFPVHRFGFFQPSGALIAIGFARGHGDPTRIATSPDSVDWTWTQMTSSYFTDIACSQDIIVVLGSDGIYTSDDTATWTFQGNPGSGVSDRPRLVAWSPGLSKFMAVGVTKTYYSTDGITWTVGNDVPDSGNLDLQDMTWSQSQSKFIVVGYHFNIDYAQEPYVAISTDAHTLVPATTINSHFANAPGADYDPLTFVGLHSVAVSG